MCFVNKMKVQLVNKNCNFQEEKNKSNHDFTQTKQIF